MVPSIRIAEGLKQGFKCPVSDTEFLHDGSRADCDRAHREQTAFTKALIYQQDNIDHPTSNPRDLPTRRRLYQANQ